MTISMHQKLSLLNYKSVEMKEKKKKEKKKLKKQNGSTTKFLSFARILQLSNSVLSGLQISNVNHIIFILTKR